MYAKSPVLHTNSWKLAYLYAKMPVLHTNMPFQCHMYAKTPVLHTQMDYFQKQKKQENRPVVYRQFFLNFVRRIGERFNGKK